MARFAVLPLQISRRIVAISRRSLRCGGTTAISYLRRPHTFVSLDQPWGPTTPFQLCFKTMKTSENVDSKIDLTVGICTWNRADLLDETLASMQKLSIPTETKWELIVVNNNSPDHTDDVIEKYCSSLPIIHCHEEKQGQSHARNLVLDQARGELLLWTDDDVKVAENWVEQYLLAFENHPQYSYFGGQVNPMYECDPPNWLSRNFDSFGKVLASKASDMHIRPLEKDELVIGANMAFRMNSIRDYRYDPLLCRKGESLAGCEDHELVARMKANGHLGCWVGTATVDHFVPAKRMSLAFAHEWWRDQARLYCRRNPNRIPGSGTPPKWLRKKYIESFLLEKMLRIRKRGRWAEIFFETAWLRGLMDACRWQKKDFQS